MWHPAKRMRRKHHEARAVRQVLAPAKLNLSLHITGKRADGYHQLQSLVTFADYGDLITLTPATKPSLTLDGPFAQGLSTTDNIALKALLSICDALHIPPHFHIQLTKNIPHGAGLGGGSADAAAIVSMILAHTQKTLPADILLELLLNLGSDVPVCFQGQACWMEGRGEIITPLQSLPSFHAVLICPHIICSTKDLFARITPPYTAPQTKPLALTLDDIAKLQNDFVAPAFKLFPALQVIYDELSHTQGLSLARMSGSGSSLFGLYADETAAQKAETTLQKALPSCFIKAICLKGAV